MNPAARGGRYAVRRNADKGSRKNGAGKQRIFSRKIENWFSERKPHMGAKKKYL